MPIKGLTDRLPQFPKIGDIRKGAPKTEGRIGRDLTYFRAVFPDDERDAAATFLEAYGAEPREINILLPFPEIARNFEAWQEKHTAGALQHRCDGETCVAWRDEDGKMHRTPTPCPGGCKPVGRLKVIIPELRRLAYIEVHTTSIWDIVELAKNLKSLAKLTHNGISGIPLVLKRRPRKISTPRKGGKRVRQEKWLLSIEAGPQWVDAKLTAMRLEALPGYRDLPALPERIEEGELVVIDDIEPEAPPTLADAAGPEWDGEVFEPAQEAPAVSIKVEEIPSEEIATRLAAVGLDVVVVKSGASKKELEAELGLQPPPQQAEPPPKRRPGERPYEPAEAKKRIQNRIAEKKPAWQSGMASPTQRGLVATKLEECFVPEQDATSRGKAVMAWLLGKESTSKLTMAEAAALVDWLLDKDAVFDGSFDLHPAARAEAAAILAEALRESGQQEMGM